MLRNLFKGRDRSDVESDAADGNGAEDKQQNWFDRLKSG